MGIILFITYDFSETSAVGLGARRVVSAMAEMGKHIIVIASNGGDSPIHNNVKVIIRRNTLRLPSRVSVFLSNLINRDFFYCKWVNKAYHSGINVFTKNHVSAIYTRANPISVCDVGIRLKKRFHVPLIMHFTDPVPAPIEWTQDIKKRTRQIKQMRSFLPMADSVSFGNNHMLSYVESTLGLSLSKKVFVSPDPAATSFKRLPMAISETNSFILLFLGNIYGNRKPGRLFNAIENLSKEYSIVLNLYGDNNGDFPSFVNVCKRTNDIYSAMQNSDVLVDIDGDDKDPVFISSKLKDYLSVNRPILSITPINSPSRDLMYGLHSVVCSKNEVSDIEASLRFLIQKKFIDSDFDERLGIIEKFNPKVIASEIICRMKQLGCNV